MVTKQEQLEWLANNLEKWKSGYGYAVVERGGDGYLYVRWPSVCTSGITKKEWQQERDKMQKKAQQAAPGNSWYERGELPPIGCECEVFVNDENKWMHFEVIAIRDGNVLGWCREGSCGFQSSKKSEFRPLITEREKAIDEMVSVILDYDGYMITSATAELVARQLHYAGYHK